jgi:ABC-type multidrug transport system ATPase subunit
MSALAKRLNPVQTIISGDFRINGKEYTQRDLKRFAGYVMQDDLLNPYFTVAETLYYHGELRLIGTIKDDQHRKERVEEILTLLDIEHCRDVIVGDSRNKGISGGERKRLAVGIELLSKPKLLFLDEPTTGFIYYYYIIIIFFKSTKNKKNNIKILTLPNIDI